jgi:TP901 family phage tail tape measure protein
VATRNTDLQIEIRATAEQAEREFQKLVRSTRKMEDQFREAERAAEKLDKELNDELAKSAKKAAEAQEKVGTAMLAVGAATVAGLALATKAAIDWESAWAGVTKTVSGSPEQMAALEEELRNLATTLPAAHAEIAGVAEAAGQLGVQRDAVAAFTKTMIDLGETTNLTADAAATAIAQLGNVLGFDLKNDVDNFGAALVALGNDGASTEADILSMAQRIGGAGAAIGLSTQDVLGFAAALSNVGIEAEAGGSSISRVLVDIAESVDTGNDKLAIFAQTAGMSVDEFVAAFEDDPARAIAAFIEGLGGVEAAGGSVFATLESLSLSEIRVRDALLRLSQSTRGVTTDLQLSAEAWDENTALIAEAEKRYDTTEAKIQIAKNAIVDLAIDIGGVLLPVVADFLEAGTDVLKFFGDLPGPVQAVATVLGTVAGVASLAAGGFLLLAPKIQSATELVSGLSETSPRAASALRGLGRAAAGLSVLGIAATAAYALFEATKEGAPSVEAATQALLNFDEASKRVALDQLLRQMEDVQDWGDRPWWKVAADSVAGFGNAAAFAAQDSVEFQETLAQFDNSVASMVQSGNLDLARESAQRLFDAMGAEGKFDDLVERILPGYADALIGVDNEQQIAAESAEGFAAGLGQVGEAAPDIEAELEAIAARFGLTGDESAKAAQDMIDEWRDAIGEFVSITGAYDSAFDAKEEAERDTAQATADATEDQSDSWEDYVGDVAVTVEEYLEQLRIMVENQENWRANMVVLTGRVSDEMLGYLASLGPEGADLVALYAQMTDAELQEAEELWRKSTDEGVQGIVDELINGGPILRQIAADHGEDIANNVRDYMIANKVGVAEAAAALGVAIDTNIPDSHNTATTVTAPPASNLASVLKTIRDHFSGITVPLTVGQPGYGVLGGSGGGGSGGGSVSGGWRTPLNSGTYRVGSPFGMRNGRMHTGQDLPARTGTPIFAARAGRVSRAATLSGSYGNHVYVDHGGGWQTRYAHMSSRFVSAGQSVGSGHRLGQVGSTGNSTGPHLHFEIRSGGRALNPRNYLRFAHGGPIEGPGGPREDRIPIWASNGEFMHQAPARKFYGDDFMHAINEMRLPKVPHYAYGGGVGVPVGDMFQSKVPREWMRGGDTFHIHAPTTSPQRLIAEGEKARNRRDAVAARGI